MIILAGRQTAMEINHRVKQPRPQSNSKKYALFRLPLKAKDALGTSLQVKIIFLVKVIITQKTKTLIFHRVKIPAKQNTEAVLRVALQERCSANMHQISRRAPMKICDFSKVAMQLY